VAKTLAEIGTPFAEAAGAKPLAAAPAISADNARSRDAKSVSGVVTLAPNLQAGVRPDDTVFVFARAVNGARAPLAVQRARVSELPLRFRLDDSMAMSPEHKLSGAAELRIEARVSRSGDATPSAGDLVASAALVKPGATQVALEIDAVRR
jgi:cytochrome c-type biogenesis protein CcmH